MELRELRGKLCAALREVSTCPSFEVDELLSKLCGYSRMDILIGTAKPTEESCDRIWKAVQCRLDGEPLQYLLGEWDFYGRTFRVGRGVLIPRADTETLVEAGLAFAKGRNDLQIADLCAGTGCIAVTMALECPGAAVYAVEKSRDALGYLSDNVRLLRAPVQVCEDDVLDPKGEYPAFDLLLSNPPYICDGEMDTLQKEVRREPEMALRGGIDGLHFYRELTRLWASQLKPGGMLAFEIGKDQEKAVSEIFKNNCFEKVCFHRDLCGIIRVVTGNRPGG